MLFRLTNKIEGVSSTMDLIIGRYIKALSIIKEITGEKISSSSTINEFVNKIKPGLTKRIYNYFKKLSTLYERWWYGPSKKNPPLLKSQDLLDRMEEDE